MSPIDDLGEHGWDKVFALNVRAPYSLAKHLIPQLAAGGAGSIVNIGSLVGNSAQVGLSHYSTAKSALLMLTRNMAREWGDRGVRANAVIPGLVDTDAWANFDGPEIEALSGPTPPLQRWGTPSDISAAVVFLASGASSYISGASILVDGGASA